MEEQTQTPLMKPALIYGLISGFVGIVLSVIFYVMDLTMETWVGLVSIAIGIIVLVYLLRAYRNEHLGGFATYGQLVLMGLLIAVISSIISAIYSYLLYTAIDPELIDKMKILAEEKIINNSRIPESMYDTMLEKMDKRMTVSKMTMNAFIFGTIGTFIIGLIVAAFLKKEKTPEEMAA